MFILDQKQILGKNEESIQLIEKVFNHIEEDIEIQIESLKLALDLQNESMITRVDSIDDYLNKILEISLKKKNNKKFKSVKVILIEELKNKIQQFFKSNLDLPFRSLIGLIDSSFVNIENFKTMESVQVNLPINGLLNLRNIFQINDDKILCTTELNSLFLLDKNFEILNKITRIGNIYLNNPFLICIDKNKENIYIKDKNYDDVIISDISLQIVKKIFNVDKQYALNELCYHKNKLYILCSNQKLILEYDSNGNFLNKIILNMINFEIEHFDVNINGIFVLEKNSNIHVFYSDGSLKNGLHENPVQDFCVIDNYIFLLNTNGLVRCIEFSNNNFSLQFERKLTSNNSALRLFCVQNSLVCFFNWSKTVNFNPHIYVLKSLK